MVIKVLKHIFTASIKKVFTKQHISLQKGKHVTSLPHVYDYQFAGELIHMIVSAASLIATYSSLLSQEVNCLKYVRLHKLA